MTYTTNKAYKLSAILEYDAVTALSKTSYNNKINTLNRSVIADPTGLNLNQVALMYDNKIIKATLGRQRIVLGNQRFVGGVAWRQNEQTYDALRIKAQANKFLNIDYGYVNQIHTILNTRKSGDIHLLNMSYQPTNHHKVVLFNYRIDIGAENFSTNTYGFRYTGKFNTLTLDSSYAIQKTDSDTSLDTKTHYSSISFSGKIYKKYTWKIGQEVLSSDNGIIGFKTPLATLHKFQGFADAFLTTPNDGLQDRYIGIGINISKFKVSIAHHEFKLVESSLDYGNELNLTVVYPVNKQLKIVTKYADFNAVNGLKDTKKAWLMIQFAI
jgi:hypothetical protein